MTARVAPTNDSLVLGNIDPASNKDTTPDELSDPGYARTRVPIWCARVATRAVLAVPLDIIPNNDIQVVDVSQVIKYSAARPRLATWSSCR